MTAATCTCTWGDFSGPESGPQPPHIVNCDEACPEHGRAADPEGWAESDRQDEGHLMSLAASYARAEGGKPEDYRERAKASLAAEAAYYAELDERRPA